MVRLRIERSFAIAVLFCTGSCGEDDGKAFDGGGAARDAELLPDGGRDASGPDAGDDGGPPPANLVGEGDLVLEYSFSVPGDIHVGSANAGFEYGGTAIGYDPDADALFITGHDWDQLSAQISIPPAAGEATILQPLTDALEGHGNDVGEGSYKIGGHLVYDGDLYITDYLYYDAPGTQSESHLVRPVDLSAGGQVRGPFRVGPLGAGFYSGYFGLIPAAWREALGGPVLNGNACLPIISRTSYGPAAFAIDPADVGVVESAIPLVYYPADHPTLGTYEEPGPNPLFNGTSQVRGVVFPENSASVLFFGRHGIGTFCYGEGTDDPALDGTPVPDEVDVVYCYDPSDRSKGTHAFPYRHTVWAYDASELARVRAGEVEPWDVRPYDVWQLTLPGTDLEANNSLGGATYDPVGDRIFVSQLFGDGDRPMIHVFSIERRS